MRLKDKETINMEQESDFVTFSKYIFEESVEYNLEESNLELTKLTTQLLTFEDSNLAYENLTEGKSGKFEENISSLKEKTPFHSNLNSCRKLKNATKQQNSRRYNKVDCNICGRFLSDAYNLRIHKMQHNKEFRYKCPQCDKKFRQRNKMEMHRITHTKDKPFICDICGKGYRFRDYLVIHRRLHESAESKPYKCRFCMAAFHTLHARRMHFQKEHTEEIASQQKYTCPVALCGRNFNINCHLIAHMKRHTEQRQYKCKLCHKSFYDQAHLQSHQTIHMQLKPFSCEICSASFRRKFNLEQHQKIHSKVKSYVCMTCDRGFAQKAGLSAHRKRNVCRKEN